MTADLESGRGRGSDSYSRKDREDAAAICWASADEPRPNMTVAHIAVALGASHAALELAIDAIDCVYDAAARLPALSGWDVDMEAGALILDGWEPNERVRRAEAVL